MLVSHLRLRAYLSSRWIKPIEFFLVLRQLRNLILELNSNQCVFLAVTTRWQPIPENSRAVLCNVEPRIFLFGRLVEEENKPCPELNSCGERGKYLRWQSNVFTAVADNFC